MKNDEFGDRMKDYEDRFRYYLPRRTYTLVRLDGKAFHTYTKGCEKPYDFGLIEDFQETMKYLCENTMGAKIAYHQSDEITMLLTDFTENNTEAYFDNNLQKLCSVLATETSTMFNKLRLKRYMLTCMDDLDVESLYSFVNHYYDNFKQAKFDCRCWNITDPWEVYNTFLWRQHDATKNSISMCARAYYSDEELKNKNGSEKQEMLFQKGINFNDIRTDAKRGACVIRTESGWMIDREIPIFSQDKAYLQSRIPLIKTW